MLFRSEGSEVVDGRYMVAPKIDRRTKEGKSVWAEFVAEAEATKKTVVPADIMQTASQMLAAIKSNPQAEFLFNAPGMIELPILWHDEGSGVWCRSKIDKVTESGVIYDIKTTTSIEKSIWSAEVARRQYHVQAAMYSEAARQAGLCHGTPIFIHATIESSAPFRTAMFVLSDASIELGRRSYQRTLAEIAQCHKTGDWADPRHSGGVVIDLPKWAYAMEESL